MALKSYLLLKEIFSGSLSTGELPPGFDSLFSPLVYSGQKNLGLEGYEFFINNTIDNNRSNAPYYFNDGNDWKILFDTGYFGYTNKWIIVNEGEYNPYKIAYVSDGSSSAPELNAWSGLKNNLNIGYSSNRLVLSSKSVIKNIYPPTGGEAYVAVKADQSWITPTNEFQNFTWRSGDVAYFEGGSDSIPSSGIIVTGLPKVKWIEVNSGISIYKTYQVRSGNALVATPLPWEYNPYTGFWIERPDNVTLYPAKDNLSYWFPKSGLTVGQALWRSPSNPLSILGWWAIESNGNIYFNYITKIPRKGLLNPPDFDGPDLNILNGTGNPTGDYLFLQDGGPSYYNYYFSYNPCTRANDQRHALPSASLSDANNFPSGKFLSYSSLGQYIPGPKGWADGSKRPPLTRDTWNRKDQNNNPASTFTGQFWLGPYATGLNYLPVANSEGIGSVIISGGQTGALMLNGNLCMLSETRGGLYPTPSQNITYMEWLGFSYESGYLFSLPKVPKGVDLYDQKFNTPPRPQGTFSDSWYDSNVYRPGKCLYTDWFPDFKIEKIPQQGPITVFNPITGALQQDVSFSINYAELLPNYSTEELFEFEKGANINVGYNPINNKYLFETTSGTYNNTLYLDRGKEYRLMQTGYANQNKKLLIFSNDAEIYTPNYNLAKTYDYHLIKLNFNENSSDKIYYSSADGLTTGSINLVGRPIRNLYQTQYDQQNNLDVDTYVFDLVISQVDTLKWPDGSCCKNGPRYRTFNWDGTRNIYPNLQFRKGSWISILRLDNNESWILNEKMYFFTGDDPKSKYLFDLSSGYNDATHLDFPGVSFAGQIPTEPYKGQYWQLIQFYVPHNMPNNLNIKYGSSGTGYMPLGNWNSTVKIVENHNNYNVPVGNYLGNNQPVFSGNLILTASDVNFSGRLPIILSGQGITDYIKAPSISTSAKIVSLLNKNNAKLNLSNNNI